MSNSTQYHSFTSSQRLLFSLIKVFKSLTKQTVFVICMDTSSNYLVDIRHCQSINQSTLYDETMTARPMSSVRQAKQLRNHMSQCLRQRVLVDSHQKVRSTYLTQREPRSGHRCERFPSPKLTFLFLTKCANDETATTTLTTTTATVTTKRMRNRRCKKKTTVRRNYR